MWRGFGGELVGGPPEGTDSESTHVADLLLEEADDLPLTLHHLDVEVDHGPAGDGWSGWPPPELGGGGEGGLRPRPPHTHSSRADTR